MRALPFVLAFALMLYAFIDCARTPREELPAGLSRLVWVLLILLLPGIGAFVWIVLRVVAAVNAAGTTGPRPRAPRRPARPVAPDDDPTFLARLEQERRREERRRRQQEQRGPGAADDPTPHRDGGGPRRPSAHGGDEDPHGDDARGDGHEGGSTTGRPEDGGAAH